MALRRYSMTVVPANTIHLHWLEHAADAGREPLRRVLASYLDCTTADVRFDQADDGKPKLAGDAVLRFNWSHTRGVAVVAVARDMEVGVDVEWRRRRVDVLALADRYFATLESRWLHGLPASARGLAFMRLWTAKEAVLKALGHGLAGGLDRVRVRVDASDRLGLAELDLPNASAWQVGLHELRSKGSDMQAAVAWLGPPCAIRQFAELEPLASAYNPASTKPASPSR